MSPVDHDVFGNVDISLVCFLVVLEIIVEYPICLYADKDLPIDEYPPEKPRVLDTSNLANLE